LIPVTVNALRQNAAPPLFGSAESGVFVQATVRPVVGRVRGDPIATPAGASDEKRGDGAAGDEAEEKRPSWQSPVMVWGKRQGGGRDIKQDAISLNGDDLIFIQQRGELDGEHVAWFVVMNDAPFGGEVIPLLADIGLTLLMTLGGADEVDLPAETGSEEGCGEVIVAHVSGEDDDAGGDLGELIEMLHAFDLPVDDGMFGADMGGIH
jgi:hypothetical protein